MRTRTSLLAFLLPLLISAQVRQGPRIGLAIATQTAGQFLQWQGLPKLGPIIGYSWEIPYTHQVGILLEPMLMSKGSWTQNAPLKVNTFITLRYLEMPLMLKLDLDTARNGYFLTGGVVPGYWISGRYRVFQNGNEVQDFRYNLNQPNVRRMQWSIGVGLGRAGDRWSWELRGQSSVTPFDRVVKQQNLVFSLQFTYRLLNYEERKARRAARSEGDADDH
jgi:hypothetical protein